MKRSMMAMAVLLAAAPLAGAAQDSERREVAFQGCVVPGTDKGTYAITQVVEVPGASGMTMPDFAHGRRVLFWLKNDDNVKRHAGRKVEIRGEFSGLEESEIELKAGAQKNGELVLEFEGPGKDVRVPNSVVGNAVGTTGRAEAEKEDVKTYLAYVDVKQVRVVSGNCQ